MINNKIRKMFSPVAGIMSMIMVMGTVSIPVYAADNNIEYVYNQSELNKDILSGNNVIEQNGTKLASKNKIKVWMELTSNKDSNSFEHNDLDIRVYMNDSEQTGGSGSRSGFEGSKMEIEEEIENQEGYPAQGIIRIDAVEGKLGLNGTLKIPVDFTEDFNNTLSKDISEDINVNGTKGKIEKFISDGIDTRIVVSRPVEGPYPLHHMYEESYQFAVDIDGKLYSSYYSSYSDEKDGREYENYVLEGLNYEKVKNASEIKITPYVNTMTQDEIEAYYNKNNDSYEKNLKEDNKVEYLEKISFADGTEGKISVVREENKIKVYCNSDSDFKSKLMAINMSAAYTDENYYSGLDDKTIFKDKDNDNQYVIEFNDIESNRKANLYVNDIVSNIDKFVIGNEVKIK